MSSESMFISYPKMKTLFKLEQEGKKWTITNGEILPDTAPLHFLSMEELVFTEKIDGTNMGVLVENGKIIHIQKRNNIANPEDKNDRFYFDEGLIPESFPEEFSGMIFGELHGTKIQKGGIYSNKREFRMFDILNIHGNKFFTWDALVAFQDKLGIKTVPEIGYWYDRFDVNCVKEFLSQMTVWCNPKEKAEGFVVRHRKDVSVDKRWMAKIRHSDFKW